MNILAYDLERIPTLKRGSNTDISLNLYKGISVNADFNNTINNHYLPKWNYISDFSSNKIYDVEHLDYIWIYSYAFPEIFQSNFVNFINKNVKSIKCIVFDLQGEGAESKLYYKFFDEFRSLLHIKEYHSKIFWLVSNETHPNYDIFYHPNFEIKFPYLIGSVNVPELDLNPNRKYLFTFLNGQLREHREVLLKKILNTSIKDLGLISCLDPKHSGLPVMDLGGYENEFLWTSGKEFFKNSYVNLVSETDSGVFTNGILITEKSIKPFIYQQLPLYLAKYGTVDYLRKYGFDMFDEIIDHSYDSEILINKRTDMILDELIKLSKMDLHTFFIENEDRFSKNYYIYLDIVKDCNNLPIDVQNWILNI